MHLAFLMGHRPYVRVYRLGLLELEWGNKSLEKLSPLQVQNFYLSLLQVIISGYHRVW